MNWEELVKKLANTDVKPTDPVKVALGAGPDRNLLPVLDVKINMLREVVIIVRRAGSYD